MRQQNLALRSFYEDPYTTKSVFLRVYFQGPSDHKTFFYSNLFIEHKTTENFFFIVNCQILSDHLTGKYRFKKKKIFKKIIELIIPPQNSFHF